MSNQIIATGQNEITQEDVSTLKHTIAKDLNDSQFKLFLSMCEKTGANPIVNEIHPSVFKGQMTVQFGYDFYIRKAKEAEGYKGYDVQLIHENDEFKMSQKQDEEGRYYAHIEEHSWGMPRGKVIGGYAIAYREGVAPFTVIMEASEVEHLKKSHIGMQKTMWTNYFSDMFKKHMLKRALKAAYGLEFDDQPEVATSDDVPEYQKTRKDITPTQEKIEQPQDNKQQSEPADDPANDLRNEINQKFAQLGIKTKEGVADYLSKNAPNINPNTATESEMVGLIGLMDMHIELEQAKTQEQQSSEDELL